MNVQVPGFSDLLEEVLSCVRESKAILTNDMTSDESKGNDKAAAALVEELTVQVKTIV